MTTYAFLGWVHNTVTGLGYLIVALFALHLIIAVLALPGKRR